MACLELRKSYKLKVHVVLSMESQSKNGSLDKTYKFKKKLQSSSLEKHGKKELLYQSTGSPPYSLPLLSPLQILFSACLFWWPTIPPSSPLPTLSSKEAASFLPFVLTLVQSFSAFSFSSSPSDTIFLFPFPDSLLQSSKNQSWRNSLFSDVGDR